MLSRTLTRVSAISPPPSDKLNTSHFVKPNILAMADWIPDWQKSKTALRQTSKFHKKKWPLNRPTRLVQWILQELSVQQRPVFPQQPPPPPRPEDEELRQQMEQELLQEQQAIAQWEDQMRQQTQLTPHPKLPQNLVQRLTSLQLCENMIQHAAQPQRHKCH